MSPPDYPPGVDGALIAMLQRDEGERLKVYDDATGKSIGPGSVVVGHPTVGVGRALDVHGISPSESLQLLLNDLEQAARQASGIVGDGLWATIDRPRQRTLIAACFNLGPIGFTRFAKMLDAVRASDWQTAAAELLASRAAQDLPDRYQRYADTLRTGA